MSLLSSEALTLEVGPHGVSLGRHGVAQMLSLDNLAAALDALPAEATPRRAALQVTVDNAWARWQVIEVPPGVVGHDEQHALVRARMIEVFGSAAQGWVFSWDARPAASVLACALDAALVQRLQAWCAARSVKLKSMQPVWLRAYAGLRGDAATGGFAQLRSREDVELVERLHALGMRIAWTNTVRVVTSARQDGRAPDGFAAHLERLRCA